MIDPAVDGERGLGRDDIVGFPIARVVVVHNHIVYRGHIIGGIGVAKTKGHCEIAVDNQVPFDKRGIAVVPEKDRASHAVERNAQQIASDLLVGVAERIASSTGGRDDK